MLCAVCPVEVFTPLYTSRVIQGIAIDKSRDTFVNAIVWMSVLSAGRWYKLTLSILHTTSKLSRSKVNKIV